MKINGFDVLDIIKEAGTPCFIYDVENIKNIIDLYQNNFKSSAFSTEVLYASKALSLPSLFKILKAKGMSIDVVSLGELKMALDAGFSGSEIYFHGNNKSKDELIWAINNKVNIVIDNLEELKLLIKLNQDFKKELNLYLRINFGIEAHTHKYILTGNFDSKFGLIYKTDDYNEALDLINNDDKLNLLGFHSHIGSQIFEMDAYYELIDKFLEIEQDLKGHYAYSLGGGFGVKYISEDKPIPVDEVSTKLIKYTEEKLKSKNLKIAKLLIEPGRSIVSDSGYTFYTLGYKKKTLNKYYYFVDGGMSDNIRPALYQAKYECAILGKEDAPKTNLVTIAGKCCESGDILIENVMLPDYNYGDILVVYKTGAYSFMMSSNYNMALKPNVIFVQKDKYYYAYNNGTGEKIC